MNEDNKVNKQKQRLNVALILLSVFIGINIYGQDLLSKKFIIHDIKQYVELLETVHPDPYINGGGKIAFHRRFHELISSIPDIGLSRLDFGWRLQEFTGWLGDPHTAVYIPVSYNDDRPGGIPLYFNAIEDELYVYGVANKEYLSTIGGLLTSIEGVPAKEIYKRHAKLTGNHNNIYNVLGTLRGKLWTDFWTEHIVPKWSDKEKIKVELKHPDGSNMEYTIEIPSHIEYPLKYPETKVTMPSTKKSEFVYKFLDDKKENALLVIKSMVGYREAFEIWQSMGRSQLIQNNKGAYERANDSSPPEDENELIAGIPSATEVFLSMLKEMKEAGTKNLLIDLRRCSGGASTMADILTYLIHGEDKLMAANGSFNEVKKYSKHYFDLHTKESIEQINERLVFSLTTNDYRFLEDKYGWNTDLTPKFQEIAKNSWQSIILRMPTFKKIYDAGDFNGFYCPDNIAVISSCNTFSSGFTLMERFHNLGAVIIGRPSGQEPNAFGSIQEYTLNNSKIMGYISHMRFGPFPWEGTDFKYFIKPDYELTYDLLKTFNFDPHADILFALEVLSKSTNE